MQGDIVTYDYFGGLYINMTNRCDCHCVFCIRDQEASALGGLWLQEEPTEEAVLEESLAQDLTAYAEIVFCGYGEPTCRADGTRFPSLSTGRTGRSISASPVPAPGRRAGRPCWILSAMRSSTCPR